MTKSRKSSERSWWRDVIPAAVAVFSLLFNIVQHGQARQEAHKQEQAKQESQRQEREIADWKSAPSLTFHHWQFEGRTRRICSAFTNNFAVAPDFLRWNGTIKVLQTRTAERVVRKWQAICASKDALVNDAKNWRFVLAANNSDTEVQLEGVTYASSTDDVRIGLHPGEALLIPVGFALAGQTPRPVDYAWPLTLTLTWEAPNGRRSRQISVRQPDNGAIGYVLDAGEDVPLFSAPP